MPENKERPNTSEAWRPDPFDLIHGDPVQPGTSFGFATAMSAMRNGIYVTHPDIEPLGYGVCIEHEGGHAGFMLTHHVRQCGMPWVPTAAEILRSDWKLWETPEE